MEYCVHCGSEVPDDVTIALNAAQSGWKARSATLLDWPARPQQPRVDETLLEQTKGLSRTYDLEPDDAEYGDEGDTRNTMKRSEPEVFWVLCC